MASHRFTVRLDDERAAWVDEQADQRDRSRAWVIREAVDAARGADSAFGAVRTDAGGTGAMDTGAVRTDDVLAAIDELAGRLGAIEDALQERTSPGTETSDSEAASSGVTPSERDGPHTPDELVPETGGDSVDADTAAEPAPPVATDVDLDDAVADVLADVEAGADANRERLRREGVRVTTWLQAREGRATKSDAVDAIAPEDLSARVWWERYAQPTLRQLADAGLVEYRSGYHDYRWLGPRGDADPVDDSDIYDPTEEF